MEGVERVDVISSTIHRITVALVMLLITRMIDGTYLDTILHLLAFTTVKVH